MSETWGLETIPWLKNLATERAQHSTICRTFPRKIFLIRLSICTKLFLRFEYLDVFSGSFHKVDEIDVLPTDSLGETVTPSNENINTLCNWELTARHFLRVSGIGSILRT